MDITTTKDLQVFKNVSIENHLKNKTALAIFLVRECEVACQFETDLKVVVKIDNHKPAIFSAPTSVSLEEALERIEVFVENLK